MWLLKKVVELEPGFISQTATYVSVVNHILKGEDDSQTIGLSEYKLNLLMPKDFEGTLPTIEELEQGLSEDTVN